MVDRSLMPGDVVKHVDRSTVSSQWGYVTNVRLYADIKIIGTNQMLKNIRCTELKPLQVKVF